MATLHACFVQEYYEGCPEDVMVGTKDCPAYFIGRITVENNCIIDHENTFLWILRYFKGKGVNVFIEDHGLKRDILVTGEYPIPALS